MARLRIPGISISIDGFVAGPRQSLENPLGVGGQRLHQWMFDTKTFREASGLEGGTTGVDDEVFADDSDPAGALIIGRNMFGPLRGPWPDDEWKGWWGTNPPFGLPVFVLTHHPRESIEMEGGTIFHFVTDGIASALEYALDAGAGKDVDVLGGASTIQQFLRADLVDQLKVIVVPILLGGGERLFDGVESHLERFECTSFVASTAVAHVEFQRR